MSYARRLAEKAVKEALFKQVEENVPIDDVVEWLYEDFGIHTGRKNWSNLKRATLKSPDVKPQDIAILLMEHDIQPDEGAWDVQPRRSLSLNSKSRQNS
ncbi:MAG: hypothetical protein GSR79_08415 [Desulfurococcales archaeon]|nr:hypothetical protein [Desulfurococcales archaeon]